MNNREEDNWKEYWRKNNPEYKKNKSDKIFKVIFFSLLSIFICFIFWTSNKNKIMSTLTNASPEYQDNELEYIDSEFIQAMESIRQLYNEDTLKLDSIDKEIVSLSNLKVTKLFESLHRDMTKELIQINPASNKEDSYISHLERFNKLFKNYYKSLETILEENNKRYYKQDDKIIYYYKHSVANPKVSYFF